MSTLMCTPADPPEARIAIYPARLIRTLDPAVPTAEALAVRDGRVLAVGTVEELRGYGDHVVDERYAEKVLVPGFVEAHSHAGSGGMWRMTYLGRFDRRSPDGRLWTGCASVPEVLTRLRGAEAALDDPDRTLVAWGLDPIYYPDTVEARDLDEVSTTRPICVRHANGHLMVVNSEALRRCGIDSSTTVEGVVRDSSGRPTGELREFAAMALVSPLTGGGGLAPDPASLRGLAQDAVNTGTTTVTDLGSRAVLDPERRRAYLDEAGPDLGVRLDVFHFGAGFGGPAPAEAAAQLAELRTSASDPWLRFGNVKLMLDGSIQGFTARLREPGYLGGEPNGLWTTSPEEFEEALLAYHRQGLLVHTHCNGDEASEVFISALERVLRRAPRWDHRHTVTHSQMTTPDQYRRMAALGMGANIFANHIWAWGDQHVELTVGPDRARRMNAAATALAAGVPVALHSDTPVTPLGPLSSMKHAVTRETPSGRVLGGTERLTPEQALRAVTLGPAVLLHRDGEIGSLEPGKWADAAILDADPLDTDPHGLPEIRVSGTMVGGLHRASALES